MLNKGFFRLAKNVSKYSTFGVRIGAVISRKSPISVGFNVEKTHPDYANPNTSSGVSIHAEIRALINADFDVRGCEIYVYRETSDGVPALAKPCESCYNTLRKNGIKKIFYTTYKYPYWACERIKKDFGDLESEPE